MFHADLHRRILLAGILLCASALKAAPEKAAAADEGANPVVAGGNEFAFDLYARLVRADKNVGRNLCFSPYSVSAALMMAAEGARGETADQIGRVLHFPNELRRDKTTTPDVPWNMAPLRLAATALNARLTRYSDRPEAKAIRARVGILRKELDAANGRTKEAIEAGDFDKQLESSEIAHNLATELNQLFLQFDPYELRVANAVWVTELHPLKKSYVDAVHDIYGGGAFPISFADQDDACRRINAWVEHETEGHIREMIQPEPGDPPIGLVLTNAVYFRGEWLNPFLPERTKKAPFISAGRRELRVAMMHQESMTSARYGAFNGDGRFFATPVTIPVDANPEEMPGLYPGAGGFAMIEIPYKGDRLCMDLIAPMDDNLDAVEKALTGRLFNDCATRTVLRKTHVFMPKFRIEGNYEIGPALKEMGMQRAFVDPRHADGAQFDGMFVEPDVKAGITKVTHKAFVEVNEKGTEAAAAVAYQGPVFGGGVGRSKMKAFTPTFRADRPFIFAIRDVPTNAILFVGRVIDPTQ